MSTHQPSVHHAEFAAGSHRQCRECEPVQTHSITPLYEADYRNDTEGECLFVLTCTVVSVKVSVEDSCDSSTSIGTYRLLLNSYIGRTMLEFQVKHKAKAYSTKCYFSCNCAHKSCGVMW